jgi:5-formyltetrahydrofolate cyclo-ligase
MTATAKSKLRKQMRERRAELARALPDFAVRIATFAGALALPPHAVVAGYWPISDEADPRALMAALAARGHTLALPRIDAKDAALSFRRWNEGDGLIDNHHAIPEPRADADVVIPDIVLVPLLAFDASGHRLGYGGGYYDRTLAALPARAIGVAYAGQEVEALAHEAHDRRLDGVITEKGVRYLGPQPSLSNLSARQKEIVRRCMAVAAEGELYPDWEFPTIFGVYRAEMILFVNQWPNLDETDKRVEWAINNALNNLAGYPHKWQRDWAVHLDFSRDEVVETLAKWSGTKPANHFEGMR